MDDHKFCFVICANSDLYLEESLHYISHLQIPEGYKADLFTVRDAVSITEAYNEAMSVSDAKYKIYLHQDVFILNKNILSDLLKVFHTDELIGMIGMVGYDTVSPDGIMWHKKRLGNYYQRTPPVSYPKLSTYNYDLEKDGFSFVALVDGFFIATSRDLPWNTKLLKGFDFYDAFQSIHFLKHGYKIVVPTQKHPWCMHDDGKILNLRNYDPYRRIFMQTYPDCLGKHYSEILAQKRGIV